MSMMELNKGSIEVTLAGPVPIVNPRLMRTVPSNISRVIGNFDEVTETQVQASKSEAFSGFEL